MKHIIKMAALAAVILATGAHAQNAKPESHYYRLDPNLGPVQIEKPTPAPAPAPRTNADELKHPTRPPVYQCDDGALVMLEMNQLGGSRLTIAWPDDHASATVTKQAGREHPYILRDTATGEIIGDARITPETVWLYVGDGFLHCNRAIKN
ncbi:TPA: hypothetical protein ACITN2_004665 [Salmonella enterica subsp. enterica serovar Virchow]